MVFRVQQAVHQGRELDSALTSDSTEQSLETSGKYNIDMGDDMGELAYISVPETGGNCVKHIRGRTHEPVEETAAV